MRCFALALVATLGTVGTAAGRPPPPPPPPPPPDDPPEPIEWRRDRAFLEWSTWARLGYGVASAPVASAARSTQPVSAYQRDVGWDGALGADVTLPFPTRRVRTGAWLELSPDGVSGGGELDLAGRDLDMFWYRGERVVKLRAGASPTHVIGAVAVGYRCPWRLWGPYSEGTRYLIGVRLVASATRAMTDPKDWSLALGIEFEPLGSLRYVGGIASWY